ncbi:MAG: hypothetical protein R3283_04045 [Balneolaceae bacterium]|nr:hypothetical protein [Balneolaceae bacterium]
MPRLSIWMIRSSFVCLSVVVLSGGLLLVNKASVLHAAIWAFLPLHYELAIWGWFVQFILGTAYWIFPRHLTGSPRGSEAAAWTAGALLNIGLLLIIMGNFIIPESGFSVSGRTLAILSTLIFIRLLAGRAVSYRNSHSHDMGEA